MIILFLLGLLIGSFLNVCIYRIPRGESIVYPSSHCTSCGSVIKPYDNIPIISYILLKGMCRNCGKKISIRYPLVEFFTGAVLVACFFKFGVSFELIKFALISCILIVTAFIDADHSIIPGKLMIFALTSGIILNIIGYKLNAGLLDYLYGMLLGGGVILLIVLLTGGMGGGDIQLMGVIGLFLGFKLTLLTLLLSFIIGGAAGVMLILLKKKSRRDYIPFGPWIAAAAFIAILFGEGIINWYISLL